MSTTDNKLGLAAAPRRTGKTARVRVLVLRTALGLGAGVVLLLAFLRLVDFRNVYQRLEHLSIGLALLCGVAFLGAYVVRALRWRCFLAPDRVSIPRVVALYQVAIFVNWLLPIRAGELVKSLSLRRSHGIPVSRSLATVTMDKAMDLLPAVGLLALLPFVNLHLSRSLWLLLLSALAALGLCVLVVGLAAWSPDRFLALLTGILVKILPRSIGQSVESGAARFIATLVTIIRQPRLMLVATMYTLVAVGLDALFCLLAFRAVGVVVPVPVVLYGYSFYNLAYMLPTPPGQIGSNELIGLLIFSGLFGVSRSGVGAMFLFSHPWTAFLMASSALLCLSAMGLTLRGTLRLTQDAESE